VNSTAAIYTYYPDGQRARKDAGGDWTEYVYANGEMLAEKKPNGDWSDYVYLGNRRIVKADNFEDRVLIQGTRCSDCGDQWYQFNVYDGANLALNGYQVQSGDKLYWRQWSNATARGGLNIRFSDGVETQYVLQDQDGQLMNWDNVLTSWHYRYVDLSGYAGKTWEALRLDVSGPTQPGNWAIYYQDIVLVSADGTVRPLYTRNQSVSLGGFGTTGMTNISSGVDHWTGGLAPDTSTTYYHGDHLGSARLMSSENGYPVWSATYLPFGYEINPQSTVNHYKFTAKERDSESGLDYFGARHYASTMGRFMSPDPTQLSAFIDDPQSWNRYSYAYNNPLQFVDRNGKWPTRIHNQIIDAAFPNLTAEQMTCSPLSEQS
jgi:RHS repeat-associated protein